MVTIDTLSFINKARENGYDGISYLQYSDAVNAINSFKLWEWVRDIELVGGFQFTDDPDFMKIIDMIDTSNHTGFTLAFMFRKIQKIANEMIKIDNFCVICHEEDHERFAMFKCGHKYHYNCIAKRGIVVCPLCRQSTIPEHIQH